MNRFIFVSLLVMAWAYWELSGGGSFVAERHAAAPVVAEPETVTRADTSELAAMPEPVTAPAVIELPAADVAALTQPVEVAPAVDPAPVEQVATEEPVPAPVQAVPPGSDLRVVTGNQVNLREGPGTGFSAIDRLGQGTIAEVLEVGSDGWVRIQVQGTQTSGWMSGDFLIPVNG